MALGARLGHVEYGNHEVQAAREIADTKLARAYSSVYELVELRKWQVASVLSWQESTAELKEVRSRLVKPTVQEVELSSKLNDVEAELDKRLEKLEAV